MYDQETRRSVSAEMDELIQVRRYKGVYRTDYRDAPWHGGHTSSVGKQRSIGGMMHEVCLGAR